MAQFQKDTFSRVALVFMFLIAGITAVSAVGNAIFDGDLDEKTKENASREIQLIEEEQQHISENANGVRSKKQIIIDSIETKKLEIERDKKMLEVEDLNEQMLKQKWQEKSGEIKGIKKALGLDEVVHEAAKAYSVTKEGCGDDVNKVLSYWYDQTGDKDMIATFISENGLVTINRPSSFTGFDGKNGWGYCQMYETWHKDFIFKNGDKSQGFSDDFLDWKTQADRCINIWNDAKKRGILERTFHAYPVRNRALKLITFH